MEFGKRVRELRERLLLAGDRRFTLRRFAQAASVSSTYQSQIERGVCGPPSPKVIRLYAALLDEDYNTLLDLAGKSPKDLVERLQADEPLRGAVSKALADPDIRASVIQAAGPDARDDAGPD